MSGYKISHELVRQILSSQGYQLQTSRYVSHFPPGTSKWNKIEHRLFSYISINRRGKPLESLPVILSLIGATVTETGLRVKAVLDETQYETGIKISNGEPAKCNITGSGFHGEWNCCIQPNC
jgi:hypothetical protein